MGGEKTIKDPLYGYIKINEEHVKLIDSPEFQRLRNIRQTGYQALYPSALHNRFVHSLGVYYLGKKAINYFFENTKDSCPDEILKNKATIEKTFILACLLHDVGHSPFSHTGEKYYTNGIDFKDALATQINSDQFTSDIKVTGIGNPHEAMSALVGLNLCNAFELNIDNELFVRSIIGAKYSLETDENIFINAIIGILNGDLIDVDKLDYLFRDAFVTGYSTITIDYERLLAGYTVCKTEDNKWCAAYERGALSVIENVFYANDLERRWIQNHPVVLYDNSIVDYAIRYYNEYYLGILKMQASVPGSLLYGKELLKTIYVIDALSQRGLVAWNLPIKLLCDDDIVAYIKNQDKTKIGEQFFDRGKRLKPLWKTEALYNDLVEELGSICKKFLDDLRATLDSIQQFSAFFINDDSIKGISMQLEDPEIAAEQRGSYNKVLHICNLFKNFSNEQHLPDFNFAVIISSRFSTNYTKLTWDKIKIELYPRHVVSLKSIVSLRAKEIEEGMQERNQSVFYVYTTNENLAVGNNLGNKFITYIRQNYNPE